MSLEPMQVELTAGQQIETLKRFRQQYQEKLEELERELTELLTANAESEFMAKYLGEQPEVTDLRVEADRIGKLEKRRQHLHMLIGRLDQVTPPQKDIKQLAPAERIRRY
jgi:predicted nuclease with TOPRIM domain